MISVKNTWLVAWVFCRLPNGVFLRKRGYLIGKFRKEIYIFNEISAILFYPSCEIGIVLEGLGFLLPDLSPHFSEVILIH